MDYKVEYCSEYSRESLEQLVGLMNASFPDCEFKENYYGWQYMYNPLGRVVSYNAYAEDGQLAAHYAAIPIKMILDGKDELGLLSLNTATHPDHQGKRLFTKLADLTYKKAAELGYKFVIGVANANSTHGFLKYLDFYLVAPLDFKVGMGDIFKYANSIEKNRVYYDESILKWRLNNPEFQYTYGRHSIYGGRKEPLFHASVAYLPDNVDKNNVGLKKAFDVFNIYVGLGLDKKGGLYFDLPRFIKRSPFNLIFRDLTGGTLPKITKDNIFFQLLDYDVA